MKYVIYGAGGIGGVIGARLHQAGCDTTLIARGEHGAKLQQDGLIPTVQHPRELAGVSANFDSKDTLILLCMKAQHTQGALEDLVGAFGGEELAVACVQNGVANESLAARYYARVYATLVSLPATFLVPGEVSTNAIGCGGVLDTGCYATGVDPTVEHFVNDLEKAGFSAKPDAQVMRLKYAKLLVNLLNVMDAALRPQSQGSEAQAQDETTTRKALARRIREEALAVYAAAGIDCTPREAFIERTRQYMQMGEIAGQKRQAGSSWQSLARGTGNIETEFLNGEITLLGHRHGVSTPANTACIQVARELVKGTYAPRSMTAASFMGYVDKAESTSA